MFYDWFFSCRPLEHPCVAVCSSLCVGKEGKKDKKEIKTFGPSGGLFYPKASKSTSLTIADM